MSIRITGIQLPVDANDKTIVNGNPIGATLVETYDATISSATSLTLNAATTSFEVLAITQAVLLKFAASVSTTDFDAVIAANQSKVFYRDPAVTVISVIEATATGAVAIIER
tara:strand:+ start:313 stop:648 length:336 start_codon:yes stop_codon:yes gene_type:complete